MILFIILALIPFVLGVDILRSGLKGHAPRGWPLGVIAEFGIAAALLLIGLSQ